MVASEKQERKIMATNSTPSTPSPFASVPPVDDYVVAQDFFWEENKNKILAAVAVFLVIAFGVVGWTAWKQYQQSEAEAVFFWASTPDQWREVMTEYPGTPVAGSSALLLAASLRKGGDWQGSTKVYQEAMAMRVPDAGALAAGAALGVAENALVASGGKLSPEVVGALQAVSEKYPDSYAAAFALFTRGDLLLNEGKEEEALQVFRDLLAGYPNALFGRMASMQMQEVAMRNASKAPAAVPAGGGQSGGAMAPMPADVPPPPVVAPDAP